MRQVDRELQESKVNLENQEEMVQKALREKQAFLEL